MTQQMGLRSSGIHFVKGVVRVTVILRPEQLAGLKVKGQTLYVIGIMTSTTHEDGGGISQIQSVKITRVPLYAISLTGIVDGHGLRNHGHCPDFCNH